MVYVHATYLTLFLQSQHMPGSDIPLARILGDVEAWNQDVANSGEEYDREKYYHFFRARGGSQIPDSVALYGNRMDEIARAQAMDVNFTVVVGSVNVVRILRTYVLFCLSNCSRSLAGQDGKTHLPACRPPLGPVDCRTLCLRDLQGLR